jgi:hypothetical protein
MNRIAKFTVLAAVALLAATGQAKANQLVRESINPTLVEWKSIDKWDGKLPQVRGNATPFVNITPK